MSIKYTNSSLSGSIRQARQFDLQRSASGYGLSYYCPEGIPADQAIFGILAAFAVAFGVLYRAVTLKTNARRKRRDIQPEDDIVKTKNKLADFLWMGKREMRSNHFLFSNFASF